MSCAAASVLCHHASLLMNTSVDVVLCSVNHFQHNESGKFIIILFFSSMVKPRRKGASWNAFTRATDSATTPTGLPLGFCGLWWFLLKVTSRLLRIVLLVRQRAEQSFHQGVYVVLFDSFEGEWLFSTELGPANANATTPSCESATSCTRYL